MKTEQEQIVAIADVLCDYCKNNTKIGEPCKSSNGTYICTSEIRRATALVEAGYGDVSEYKAEIKRLKAEFKQLETNAEILAWGVRDLNHENYELTEKVKQAKIDVLNKAKERLDSAPNGWAYTTYIDELIEEVENEQKD